MALYSRLFLPPVPSLVGVVTVLQLSAPVSEGPVRQIVIGKMVKVMLQRFPALEVLLHAQCAEWWTWHFVERKR